MREWLTKTKHTIRDWLIREAGTRRAEWILAAISFAESSFFPIPPDFFLIPMILARRDKWLRLSTIVVVGSVLGALFGYIIGAGLYETVAQPLIDFYDVSDEVARVEVFFNNNVFLSLFVSAFTPIPFKVFTIAGGIFKVNLLTFIIASVLGRGARFWFEGYIMGKLGKQVAHTVFKYFNWLALFLIVVVVIYFLIK